MKIDDALRVKLVKAVEKAGGAKEFSRQCGINAANISRYLRGVISSIKDDNWEKLAPFLENTESAGRAFSRPVSGFVPALGTDIDRFLFVGMGLSPVLGMS